MKIGFVDSIFNYADVFEAAARVMEEKVANVQVERMTSPHLLKVPVCCKLLFSKGCDAIVVFLTITEEDVDEVHLVHEKIIDVEVDEKKFVFPCIVFDHEFKDQKGLEELVAKRLGFIMDAVTKMVNAPGELSSDIQNSNLTDALNFLGGFASSIEDSSEGQQSDLTDVGNSLF